MPNEASEFPSFLNERIKSKGFTLKRLAEVSGIHLKHLENLVSGNFSELPPAPYVRGYLNILGSHLNFDPAPWWEQVRSARSVKSSGPSDELPRNRFVPQAITPRIWLAAGIVLLALYLGFRFAEIFGKPVIEVLDPREAAVSVGEPLFRLRGRTENANQLFVNGEPVPIARDGAWEKDLPLVPGLNTITISAKKFLGQETAALRQIVYEPPAAPAAATSSEPAPLE